MSITEPVPALNRFSTVLRTAARFFVEMSVSAEIRIVGEDPAATMMVWDRERAGEGAVDQPRRLLAVRSAGVRRKQRASYASNSRGTTCGRTSTRGNQYADDSFIGVEYGLHGGFKGHGFAETSVRRARLTRNTRAGSLGNFNALDLWVWDPTFDCATSITNTGRRNFHVYNSVFRRSTLLFMCRTWFGILNEPETLREVTCRSRAIPPPLLA